MIPIDKNMPIPEKSKKRSGKIYPFNEMEIGDSFFVETKHRAISALTVTHRNNTNKGKRFTSRRVNESGKSGLRIWREK